MKHFRKMSQPGLKPAETNPAKTATGIISNDTVYPGSSSPIYIMSYYIKWVTTSWTCGILYSMLLLNRNT